MIKYNAQMAKRIQQALRRGSENLLLSDDAVAWTGREVSEKISELRLYIERTTAEGHHIGVSFPNSATQALVLLAILSCRRVPVILSHADLSPNPEEIINLAQLAMIITLPTHKKLLPLFMPVLYLDMQGNIEGSSSPLVNFLARRYPISLAGTALVLFTSGSTGTPKGVHVPETGLLATVDFLTEYFGLNETTKSTIVLPICHSMGLNTQFFPTFFAGGHCFFMNSWLGANRIYKTIQEQQGCFISAIGEVLQICWEEQKRRNLGPAPAVRHVQLAGGMITERHLNMAREIFPNAIIHKGYGLTEGIRVTMSNSQQESFLSDSVGKPLPFVEVEIRENGQPVRPGEVGEIHIKGPNVMVGVTGSNVAATGSDGFLPTGDLGYWNELSEICIVGRSDSLFKFNGRKVSGHEIEKIALESSNLINHAKCILMDDSARGRDKLVLLLEVSPERQDFFLKLQLSQISDQILSRFRSLSSFPKEVVLMARFPRKANGKIALNDLKTEYVSNRASAILEHSLATLQFYRLSNGGPRKGNLF